MYLEIEFQQNCHKILKFEVLKLPFNKKYEIV